MILCTGQFKTSTHSHGHFTFEFSSRAIPISPIQKCVAMLHNWVILGDQMALFLKFTQFGNAILTHFDDRGYFQALHRSSDNVTNEHDFPSNSSCVSISTISVMILTRVPKCRNFAQIHTHPSHTAYSAKFPTLILGNVIKFPLP